MSTPNDRRYDDDEPEVREHFTSGATRAQFRRELRRGRRPAVLIIALAIVATAVGINLVRNVNSGSSPFADRYQVDIAVSDASGIVPRVQEVRMFGVPVGRISAVELDGRRPIVTLSILKKYGPLYRDAKLRLRPQTPLNDLYVDVGSRGTPAAGRTSPGAPLPQTATNVPVQFGQFLDIFQPPTRQRIRQFLDSFGPALSDDGDQLRAALTQLTPFLRAAQRLSTEVAERKLVTRRLVTNLGRMLDELAGRDRQLVGLVDSGQRTLTQVARRTSDFDQALAELPGAITQARSTFAELPDTLARARRAFTALKPVADVLPAGLESLQDFSEDATPALGRLRPAVARLEPLLSQLRPLAAGLNRSFTSLRPSAPPLDQITRQVVPCEDALRNFFTDTLSVFKFANVDHAFPRGQLSVNGGTLYQTGKSCAPGGPRK